jgi:predicted house-cleaning noncanonical NTP pyrophosphatase (MazG superfamily)
MEKGVTGEPGESRHREALEALREEAGIEVDTLAILDVDANLIRTDRYAAIVEGIAEKHGISKESLFETRKRIEESGGSFDMFSALREMNPAVADDVIEEVKEESGKLRDLAAQKNEELEELRHEGRFEEAQQLEKAFDDSEANMFFPGVIKLLGSNDSDTARAFVTRGGEESQLIKLQNLMGLDLSKELSIIVQLGGEKTKAEMCTESYASEAGAFMFRWLRQGDPSKDRRVVNVLAHRVIIVEDKASELLAIGGLPEDQAIGYWHRTGNRKSQILPKGAELPGNIYEVGSLFEIGQLRRQVGRIALGGDTEWTQRNRLHEYHK